MLNRAWYETLRTEVLSEYGGRCICCGENEPKFLAIDHINGNGAEHRRQHGGGRRTYRWLRKNGFPKDNFQILCHNCNLAKGFYGTCPHRTNGGAA